MLRRHAFALAIGCCCLCGYGCAEQPQAAGPPNLVFILIDDLGWNDIGYHDRAVLTPTLDALAAGGVVLDRHYVYRYCSPTRASLLSGRLPHHAHQTNPGGESPFGTNENMTLLPARLRAAGYRTAMRGKWHLGFSRPDYLPGARGFEDAAGYLQGACDHFDESTGCAVDSWRSSSDTGGGGGGPGGPDTRNGTGYDSFRHAADMVEIISRAAADHPRHDPRPLFLYASLHVVHNPAEAPAAFVARYNATGWCAKRRTVAAMASVADNVTAQLVAALQRVPGAWENTVLVVSSDNGGDSGCSSNHPLRGRKRTFFEGGVRAAAFVHSPLLPAARAGGRVEGAFLHVSDWYPTFLSLAGAASSASDNPADAGPGRFPVDGVNVWSYLVGDAVGAPQPHANGTLVLGFNYSADNGVPSGALIDVATGYKLVVGSQQNARDTLTWDAPTYPCATNTSNHGPDCTPHCLYNVLDDPSELRELSGVKAHAGVLADMLGRYAAVGAQTGMPNPADVMWGEQGRPYDPQACAQAAAGGGYWRPWLPPLRGVQFDGHSHTSAQRIKSFTPPYALPLQGHAEASPGRWLLVVQPGAPARGVLHFTSIQAAIDASRPGDTIQVRSGTHEGSLVFSRSGTWLLPITLVAFPGDRPCIIPGPEYDQGVVIRAAWIVVDGFEIRDGYNGIEVVGPAANTTDNAAYVTIRNCWIHNNGDRSAPKKFSAQGILLVSVYDVLVEQNTIERNGLTTPDDFLVHGIYLSDFYQKGMGDITIRNNTLREHGGGGIQVFSDGGFTTRITVVSNAFVNNTHELIAVRLSNSTVYNNTFQHDWHPNSTSPDSSVLWFELCSEVTFEHNSITSSMRQKRTNEPDFFAVKWHSNAVKPTPQDSRVAMDYDEWQVEPGTPWQIGANITKPNFATSFQNQTGQELHGHIRTSSTLLH
jgi:leishmanolysin-like peptidase